MKLEQRVADRRGRGEDVELYDAAPSRMKYEQLKI